MHWKVTIIIQSLTFLENLLLILAIYYFFDCTFADNFCLYLNGFLGIMADSITFFDSYYHFLFF